MPSNAKIFDGNLLRWPSCEEVNCQFPKLFKKYPDTRMIINATEFFIKKPTFPCTQKARPHGVTTNTTTRSNYWWELHPVELSPLSPNCGLAVQVTIRLSKKVVLLTYLRKVIITNGR